MHELIADIEGRVRSLTPYLPEPFYTEVSALSAAVGKLRRIARVARDTAQISASVSAVDSGLAESDDRSDPQIEAVRFGDEWAFAGQVEPYRRELQVHCYRMVGSYDDSDDLVQETLLRAWRSRDGFQGRSTVRTWLYRIATNACLDFLRRNTRRPQQYGPSSVPLSADVAAPPKLAWLQPFPDQILDEIAAPDLGPDAAVVSRETMELVFLTAIQHLPPRQRAALIIRDVLGWPAADTAAVLHTSVDSVNSALQRARSTMRQHLPERRLEWAAPADPTPTEQQIVKRYMQAARHGDITAMADLLSEDARLSMPPNPIWFGGREAILTFVAPVFDPNSTAYLGRWRHLPTRANRQPALAAYVQRPGTTVYRAQVLDVLRIQHGKIIEITSFEPHLFAAFGLPLTL